MSQRVIVHADMDAFFASVEQRDHPEWRGKPVIVGSGPHERGVISTCSYEARKFGVHSAMPSRTAYERCPHGIFVKPNMAAYSETSDRVFEIFGRFTPFVEAVSIDEAFLDVSGSAHLFGGAVPLAEKLRAAVREECGVTCSVGVAPNRLLAKIGSEQRKPDGLFAMPFDRRAIEEFLAPKPVGIIWGVGKKTAEALARYGYRTCGDIQRADMRFLVRILGECAAESIRAHAFGLDDSEVAPEGGEEKSVSREHTFAEDESDRETVRSALIGLADEVGRRFRRETRWAATGKLKLRDADFNTLTRQAKFPLAARDDISFRHMALEIFDREWPEGASNTVRLVGFGVSDFRDAPEEPEAELFATPLADLAEKMRRRERLSAALDEISRRTDRP